VRCPRGIEGAGVFGFSEEQVSEFGVTVGLTLFIGYMLFIIYDLARKSKAGKLGTFVLFFVLAFGMLGFIAKAIIQKVLGL
jgi:hypothetical protein